MPTALMLGGCLGAHEQSQLKTEWVIPKNYFPAQGNVQE